MAIYTYSIPTDIAGSTVDTGLLVAEIAAAVERAPAMVWLDDGGDSCMVMHEPALDTDELTAQVAAVAAHDPGSLARVKTAKAAAVDARTDELIEAGFEFPPASGMVFVPTANFQRTLMGTMLIKGNPALTYPIEWSTADNSGKITLANATDVENFYLTGLGAIRAHKDSGTAIKDQINAATTVAEVEAVEDLR